MFADDLVIFSKDLQAIQSALDELNRWCSENRLQLNVNKTKIMKIRIGGRLKNSDIVTYNNKKLDFVNEYEYLGVTLQPSLAITKHLEKKMIKASHAIGSINNMQNLSINTISKKFTMKIRPIMCYSLETFANKISAAHLFDFDKVKAKLFKKGLGLHKDTSNTLVFHMAGVKRFGEEIISKYAVLLKESTVSQYLSKVEEKILKFTIDRFTDGPAFQSNHWKGTNQTNRHYITRFTVHGFHNKFCSNPYYHTEFEKCVCKLCSKPIESRYHLMDHLDEISLTSFLEKL